MLFFILFKGLIAGILVGALLYALTKRQSAKLRPASEARHGDGESRTSIYIGYYLSIIFLFFRNFLIFLAIVLLPFLLIFII